MNVVGDFRVTKHSRVATLVNELVVSYDGNTLVIPKGFKSNGASIPIPVLNFTKVDPLDDRWLFACIVHDALIGEKGTRATVLQPLNRPLTWEEATIWFDEALRYNKTPSFYRRSFVAGVKLYGLWR